MGAQGLIGFSCVGRGTAVKLNPGVPHKTVLTYFLGTLIPTLGTHTHVMPHTWDTQLRLYNVRRVTSNCFLPHRTYSTGPNVLFNIHIWTK